MNARVDEHSDSATATSLGPAVGRSRAPGAPVAILLVEDNPGDAMLVEEHLAGGLGMVHEVVHRKRLADAIQWLGENRCDLVLLDLSLPDSRGLGTLQSLQGHSFDVPVVVLTGVDDDALASASIQNGAQDYLPKDAIDPVKLARTVRYAIERKQWEDSVRLNDERIQRLEKNEAVARLSEGIAHNFNNVLTAIIGNCELLVGRLAGDEKSTHHAEAILQAARQASELTRELKSFCRDRKPQPQRVELGRFLTGLEPLLRGVAHKHVDLRVDAGDDGGWTLADPGELEQVVLNLVQNAQEALGEPGGLVAVRAQARELAQPLVGHPDTVPAGRYAVIEVRDSGPGIDPRVLPHIFETFFTTKGGKRPGLGLSTSLTLVRRSHGFVVVETDQHGAGFAIWLPRVADEAPAGGATAHRAPRGIESVLLVEDDALIAAVIAETLSAQGYRILVASSGEEALSILRQTASQVGVLVSDIDMPGISGYELAQRVAALSPQTRIILISGHEAPMPAAQGLIAAYLPKPFSPLALAKTIREVASTTRHQHA